MPAPIFEALLVGASHWTASGGRSCKASAAGTCLEANRATNARKTSQCGGIRAQFFALLRKRPNCCAAAKSREGSKTVFPAPKFDFRYTPESRLNSDIAACPKGANRRHRLACSITSSAAASSASRIRAMKTAGRLWPGLSASSDFDLCR
jgi:hypothetical protein